MKRTLIRLLPLVSGNWTLGENTLDSIEVVKCGKILPIIEAPLGKQVKNSMQKGDCTIYSCSHYSPVNL
jgi:hypothetical protein